MSSRLPESPCAFLADCSLSRKLACPALAGRPIAAQYGGYALWRAAQFDDGAAQ
jgi:hypothetical protein